MVLVTVHVPIFLTLNYNLSTKQVVNSKENQWEKLRHRYYTVAYETGLEIDDIT